MLGLPDGITACLFDLDGVLTNTAAVHAKAWKQMFDAFLGDRGRSSRRDYDAYVDGKPREDGIRDFLASRDVHPIRRPRSRARRRARTTLVLKLIHDEGVEAYPGSRPLPEGRAATPACDARSSPRATTPRRCCEVTGHRPSTSRSASTATSSTRSACAASPRRTRSSEGARRLGVRARAGRRVRGRAGRASRPGRAGKLRLRRRRRPRRPARGAAASTAPTSSSTTWPSCCDHASRVHASSRGR